MDGAFLGGLHDEIRIKVQAACLQTLLESFELPCVVEGKSKWLGFHSKEGHTAKVPPWKSLGPPKDGVEASVMCRKGLDGRRVLIKKLTPKQIKEKRRGHVFSVQWRIDGWTCARSLQAASYSCRVCRCV